MWRPRRALADVVVPAMAAAGRGRVVLVGSRVAQGMPGRSQYAATKAALLGAGAQLGRGSGRRRA